MKCNERRLARLVAGVFSLALALVPVALAQSQEPNAAKDSKSMTQATLNEQLLEACRDGQIDNVKELLEAGADVNITVSDSWTALMEACREGNLSVVKHLLESGADVNTKNGIGSTALGVAEEHGAPREIIDLLVAHGARGGPGDY